MGKKKGKRQVRDHNADFVKLYCTCTKSTTLFNKFNQMKYEQRKDALRVLYRKITNSYSTAFERALYKHFN